MARIFVNSPSENLAAEQMQTANQTAATQLATTVKGGKNGSVAGSFRDVSAHAAALPSFLFVVAMIVILFFLVFHSHLSLAASVGVGKR